MPAGTGPTLPSLSQIVRWDTAHLSLAATDWSATAEHWGDAFDNVHRGTLAPGGTVWEGAAAEAAQGRAFGDLVKVRGVADSLSGAATFARRGAEQLSYLQRQPIEAINEAHDAGFTVGEDLSLTDTSKYSGSRSAAMRKFATTIAARAAALSSADTDMPLKSPPRQRNSTARDCLRHPKPSKRWMSRSPLRLIPHTRSTTSSPKPPIWMATA